LKEENYLKLYTVVFLHVVLEGEAGAGQGVQQETLHPQGETGQDETLDAGDSKDLCRNHPVPNGAIVADHRPLEVGGDTVVPEAEMDSPQHRLGGHHSAGQGRPAASGRI
jgi:hypothetical protein